MSWWISLNDESGIVKVQPFEEGGSYVVGGSNEADLNITYNYSQFYYRYLNQEKGLRWLNGQKAADVTEALDAAIKMLGTAQDDDYWAATPGNAGHALSILLRWAKQYPEAQFRVN